MDLKQGETMSISELVARNRSYRRFDQSRSIERSILEELVGLARLAASGANKQPLRYMLACDAKTNSRIFPTLAWAAYIKDWDGPLEGEKPAAYIVILEDKRSKGVTPDVDLGIAAQSMMLGAVERGLGGCMVAAIKRDSLRKVLQVPEQHEIKLVLALGVPAEKVVVDDLGPDGDIRYWRDAQDVHHVPKRRLEDLII